ncbi:hypothetical protein [Alteromonas ponticola]|uniref:Uncharacterized protein n=1 Tax=Alteromonas ponticola TaxID=2720613 RepID=A0ABX1R221_9ALTE|nr:hypothetical protein [Alteromonas ponticola]NMH59122.1 hypothetical protein [Alteromonas ponticola]
MNTLDNDKFEIIEEALLDNISGAAAEVSFCWEFCWEMCWSMCFSN